MLTLLVAFLVTASHPHPTPRLIAHRENDDDVDERAENDKEGEEEGATLLNPECGDFMLNADDAVDCAVAQDLRTSNASGGCSHRVRCCTVVELLVGAEAVEGRDLRTHTGTGVSDRWAV